VNLAVSPALPESLRKYLILVLLYAGGDIEKHPGPRPRRTKYIARPPLPEVTIRREVEPATRNRRKLLVLEFEWWLKKYEYPSLSVLCERPKEFNQVLDRFGRELYYSHERQSDELSELLNAITSENLLLKGKLPVPSALLSLWRELEPSTPHLAMPFVLMLAKISVGILNGWPRQVFTEWAGFMGCLRPVESYTRRFSDYSLPRDRLSEDEGVVYVRVESPKTKWISARKQHSRFIDIEFVRFAMAVQDWVGDSSAQVIPGGPSTYTRKFTQGLIQLGVPSGEPTDPTKIRGYTAASLRGGGGTFLFDCSNDVRTTMWTMRLESQKSLEHYLQQYGADNSVSQWPAPVRARVRLLASVAVQLVHRAVYFLKTGVPTSLWRGMLS